MNQNSKQSFFPSINVAAGVDDTRLRRDHSLLTASRDTLKKQLSFIKLYHKFQEVTQQSESISRRRYLINDIMTNWSRYPQMRNKLTFKTLMELDLSELEEIIETQKLNIKMEDAASFIQREFRKFAVWRSKQRRARAE